MKALIARTAGVVALMFALNYLVLVGIGLLLTKVLGTASSPPDADEQVNDRLADNRTPEMNDVSYVLSEFGHTITIVALLIVVAAAIVFATKKWRPSIFLVLAVSGQALVFLLVTLTVSRERPDVRRLDASPPTASFPSGHTGASTALYVSCALLLLWLVRRSWLQMLAVTVLLSVPLLVAFGRLYRGMHHPTDVLGAYLNGAACVAISAGAILGRGPLARIRPRGDEGNDSGQAMGPHEAISRK